MEKRILGKTGLNISVFAFGGIVVMDTPEKDASNIVAEAVSGGINYFDVAPSYGNSEEILGPALKPYRSKVYLACKTGAKTKKEAEKELENSLKLLKTDYFDVYQLHAVGPEDVDTVLGPGGALEFLAELKRKGIARNIGITTHFDKVAIKLMKAADFDTLLFPVNWACWFKNGLGIAALEEAAKKNMGRLALKGLAYRAKEKTDDGYPKCWYRPIFDDPRLAELALRFTLAQNVHSAVSPGDIRMLRLGLSIIEKYNGMLPALNPDEKEELRKKAETVEKTIFDPAA